MEQYIQSELLVLIPVLYALGLALKQSKCSDALIPWILGGVGIALSCLYVFSTNEITLLSVFTAITQGILCASASVYANQLYKQTLKKRDEVA